MNTTSVKASWAGCFFLAMIRSGGEMHSKYNLFRNLCASAQAALFFHITFNSKIDLRLLHVCCTTNSYIHWLRNAIKRGNENEQQQKTLSTIVIQFEMTMRANASQSHNCRYLLHSDLCKIDFLVLCWIVVWLFLIFLVFVPRWNLFRISIQLFHKQDR